MTSPINPARYEVRADSRQAYLDLRSEYQASLVAPLDDMWASFADMAKPYALVADDDIAGCCSIDEDSVLQHFYVRPEFEAEGEEIFAHVVADMDIRSVVASTVDPGMLSVSLAASQQAVPVALMFDHVAEPEGTPLSGLRLAASADLEAAIEFVGTATGDPADFLGWYVRERIDRQELYLHHVGGRIAASGECRIDQRVEGYAHLGIVVGKQHRSQGMGTQLMNALVEECSRRDLTPLCSTEPENTAAQHAIRQAGFRSRHRVFRLNMAGADRDNV